MFLLTKYKPLLTTLKNVAVGLNPAYVLVGVVVVSTAVLGLTYRSPPNKLAIQSVNSSSQSNIQSSGAQNGGNTNSGPSGTKSGSSTGGSSSSGKNSSSSPTGTGSSSSSGSGGDTGTSGGSGPVNNTCSLSNTSGCDSVGGKTITFNNVTSQQGSTGFLFQCTGSLASYSDARAVITGSGWPVHLNLNFTAGSYDYAHGQALSAGTIGDISGVSLANGCTGDGDPNTIDLIVHIQGDGRTYGLQKDAFKINGTTGPSSIQLTTGGGSINCGPREGADALTVTHQDGIQVQNGDNIGFYGVTVGDWFNQRATCWGAGGAFFISAASGHSGTNITINHMKAIACNHGLNGDAGGAPTSGSVSNSVFRTGRSSDLTDKLATIDPETGTNTVGLCSTGSTPVSANTLGLSSWSFTNLVGDAWSPSGQAWSPGFNPAYNSGL